MKIIKIISIFCSVILLANKASYAKDFQYKIMQKEGMIGCITQDIFRKAISFSLNKNVDAIQALISSGQCIYLVQGTFLYSSHSNLCGPKDKDTDVSQFKPNGLNKLFFFPCASIKNK